MKSKEDRRRLVDELPESEFDAAGRYLEYLRNLRDPFLRTLMETPVDNEPTTLEEEKGAEEAWQEYLRGEARPWEEVRMELASE